MLNESGSAFFEAILTLAILLVLTSFLPLIFHLKSLLHNKQLDLHASEVAYEAILIATTVGVTTGIKQIDQTEYYWQFDGETICVHYSNGFGERRKCINQEGEF